MGKVSIQGWGGGGYDVIIKNNIPRVTKLQNRGNHAIRVEEGELAQERRPGPDGEGFTEYQAN